MHGRCACAGGGMEVCIGCAGNGQEVCTVHENSKAKIS